MKAFPILYSRTSTNAVQTWQIFVDGNTYYSESGQVNGAITRTKPTVCFPKNVGRANETTANQQALSDAKNKFKKKLKEGNFEDINDIDKFQFVWPMLAKKFVDRKDKIVYPVGVQLKFNGGRCIATKNGLHSRKGEPYVSVPHIWESLKAFFAKYPEAVLDGELYAPDCGQRLNEVMQLIRKSIHVTAEDLAKSEKLVKYFVYDCYDVDGVTQESNYKVRAETVKKHLSSNPYYRRVITHVAKNEEEVMKIYDKFVQQGEEGAIVRLLDAPYENKRSSNLLKLKPTDDAEFLILDVEEGEGNRSGMAGRVILQFTDKRTFAANVKGNESLFEMLLRDKKKYIGKKATIFFNGYTGLGLPNYAQFDCNSSMGGAADK